MSNLVIRNGEIITSSQRYVADIYCEDGIIAAIGKNLSVPAGTEEYDASGKYVFPGFIDPHTHVYLPFMGTFSTDTYETATIAALCGGTTTLIDFCIPGREESPLNAIKTWTEQSEGKAASDFTWHMAVTRFDDEVARELKQIVDMGITSFKVFLAYGGALGVDDKELYQTMKLAKELGVIVCAHCENSDMIDGLQKKLLAEGKTGPEWHEPSRPTYVEAEGTRHFCTMSRLTGAAGYIVHLSCEEALKEATEAQLQGANIWVETLIQHLLLDKTDAERPDFEGANFVMSPPLRKKENQAALWAGFAKGHVATLGSDHAPFNTEQKKMGKDNFCLIPNGIPSLEDRVRMFYTHGVETGRVDIHRFVDVASTQAAKLFGLFPKKGTIQIGSDADIVVYDQNHTEKISVKTHHMNIDYNPFEGWDVKGSCALVTVRGHIQVRNGEFVGKKGIGKLIKRKAIH